MPSDEAFVRLMGVSRQVGFGSEEERKGLQIVVYVVYPDGIKKG